MIEPLVPISVVARRFGMRASALRFYEEIRLLPAAVRRSGRRYYGPKELRRLALIQLLQDAGGLSLAEIAEVVAIETSGKHLRKVLNHRIAVLAEQIRAADAARSYLEYRLSCPRDNPFDGCPVLAKEVDRKLKGIRAKPLAGREDGTGVHPGRCDPDRLDRRHGSVGSPDDDPAAGKLPGRRGRLAFPGSERS